MVAVRANDLDFPSSAAAYDSGLHDQRSFLPARLVPRPYVRSDARHTAGRWPFCRVHAMIGGCHERRVSQFFSEVGGDDGTAHNATCCQYPCCKSSDNSAQKRSRQLLPVTATAIAPYPFFISPDAVSLAPGGSLWMHTSAPQVVNDRYVRNVLRQYIMESSRCKTFVYRPPPLM